LRGHFKGLVFRAHNPYWSFSPTSGEGAKRHGGRFNPKGMSAFYTSLTQTVALAEYHQGFVRRPQPTTLCAYAVDCENIVDLTDLNTQDFWDIKSSDLSCAWELIIAEGDLPPSWKLSQHLIENGVVGIIVPSFAVNSPVEAKNLVFWQWKNTKPHQVLLIDDDKLLPGNQSSWTKQND